MQVYGTIFFLSMNNFMGNFFNSILVFQSERPVFLREQSNRMYSVFSYYLAKSIMDLPALFVATISGTLISYFILKLQYTPEQYFLHMSTLLMNNIAAQSIGLFLSSIFESPVAATQFAPAMIMPLILFGGLFSNNGTAPKWLSWLAYVSPFKYTSESLLDIEFLHDPYKQRDGLMKFLDFKLGFGYNYLIFLAIIIVLRVLSFILFKSLVKKF